MNNTASEIAVKLDENAPQIFRLNVDCFENLFEWFSLSQLLAFRCTCKRMKAVVDYYIRLNYPRILRFCIKNRQTLLELCDSPLNYFEWIRHLYIWTVGLNGTQAEDIRYIFDQLETLKLCWVRIDGDFYDVVLKHCKHLKYLGLRTEVASKSIIGTRNAWLRRQYPTLEHFELDMPPSSEEPFECTELSEFFHRNPNIRVFSTDSAFLLASRQFLLSSTIKLDRLDIFVNRNLNTIHGLTNDLYRSEFYKQLHLYSGRSDEFYRNQAQHLWSLHNVEKLNLYSLPDDFQIPVVDSIKKLSIHMCTLFASDVPKMMATNFIGLREIEIQFARLHDIRSFVCYAKSLKELKVWNLLCDNVDEPKSSDFIALNREREQLNQARKVTIFIDEKNFLKMKWTSALKFSLIELKQIESVELDHLYNWIV